MRAPTNDNAAPVVLVSRTRRLPAALLGVAVGVGGTLGVGALTDADASIDAGDNAAPVLATAPVEIRDLIEEVEWTGALGYGTAVDISASRDGTVTATVEVGSILRRGDVAVEIDEEPVVVLYGSVPAWRDLDDETSGPDVLQLETNLVALGYDPDSTVTVDEEYTAATEAMVERWQEDLGREETGTVAMVDVLIVDGPVSVTTAPRVGDPARQGEALGSVSARAIVSDVVTPVTGTVEAVIEVGAPVEDGTVLFTIDGVDVLATTDPSLATTDNDAGDEQAFVLVAPDRQVASSSLTVGDVVTEPSPALTLETQTLSIIVSVALDSIDEWTVGQDVSIELPDGTESTGVVVDVGTVAQGGGQGVEPTIEVAIEFLELVDDDLPASDVTITVVGSTTLGATVVPTRALVTLAEGGFAVEKMQADGTTVLVAIETGAFDDGVVAIESSQLSVGDQVVVPT